MFDAATTSEHTNSDSMCDAAVLGATCTQALAVTSHFRLTRNRLTAASLCYLRVFVCRRHGCGGGMVFEDPRLGHYGETPAILEYYSSWGNQKRHLDANGNMLPEPTVNPQQLQQVQAQPVAFMALANRVWCCCRPPPTFRYC